MGLTVAFQMDPIETVDINGDSSFALAVEAQRRGHALLHYLPRHLSFRDRKVEFSIYAPEGRNWPYLQSLGELAKPEPGLGGAECTAHSARREVRNKG